MAREVFEAMSLKPGDTYVDGTLGLGGHALEAANFIRPGGKIYGFDWDRKMLETAKARLSGLDGAVVEIHNIPLFEAPELLESENVRPNGVLLDLGLNSAQVDDPARGFSFSEDGPLDMRMDQTRGEPASALLNRMTPSQIENMLIELGDERWGRAIAKQIALRRQTQPLRTTFDLVECVLAAVPKGARDKSIHPATRTFQAVRLKVTGELVNLDEAIRSFAGILAPSGVMVILSYHSGEDRIVKSAFKSLERGDSGISNFSALYSKPLRPAESETSANRRARSARLRALKRAA